MSHDTGTKTEEAVSVAWHKYTDAAGGSIRGGRPDGPDEDALALLATHGPNLGLRFASLSNLEGSAVHPSDKERSKKLSDVLKGVKTKGQNAETDWSCSPEDIAKVHASLLELRRQGVIKELNILCDGMGGGGAGEIASSIAVHIIEKSILKAYQKAGDKEQKTWIQSSTKPF